MHKEAADVSDFLILWRQRLYFSSGNFPPTLSLRLLEMPGRMTKENELKTVVDINCDMGEAFGRWRIGDTKDEQLISHISSANIATGFHAGDPNLMDETVRLASEHGVAVGAHPGYNDLQGFGRRRISATTREIVNDIIYQVGALREFARRHAVSFQHVKPHGALYMELAVNAEIGRASCRERVYHPV